MSEYQAHDDSSDNSEGSFPFKYAYGVNAWKHWVKSRCVDEDLPELEELKPSKYFQKSATRILTWWGELLSSSDFPLGFLIDVFTCP